MYALFSLHIAIPYVVSAGSLAPTEVWHLWLVAWNTVYSKNVTDLSDAQVCPHWTVVLSSGCHVSYYSVNRKSENMKQGPLVNTISARQPAKLPISPLVDWMPYLRNFRTVLFPIKSCSCFLCKLCCNLKVYFTAIEYNFTCQYIRTVYTICSQYKLHLYIKTV
jgi:hypothetical protein